MSRHATPWKFEPDYCVDSGATWVVVDADGDEVAEGMGRGAQMEHAVECVNALGSVKDPAAFATELREAEQELQGALQALRDIVDRWGL